MFSKILIANRGEVACRIIRTCRKLGIKTVAVYSEADAQALHVQDADEAHLVGAAPPEESYLNISSIIEAAGQSQAEAIHPGYGFLSQNADFARACQKADITFIGPLPKVMKRMGDKVRARKLARKAGLPVLPGSEGEVKDEGALQRAQANGYPLMVKAASGGGGIGIQVVHSPTELKGVMSRARSLARKAFGSRRIYFERFLEGASHVEVQVVADNHGNLLHLYERDCSVQRRNQKVVEEAPSTKLTSEQRQLLFGYSLALARYIEYTNVGTVEFLVSQTGEVYFLEMNTRLQVEHGITELITGIDMVELQIRIAAGEPLPLQQQDVQVRGHAIEARINAEDPETFLPSAGVIDQVALPAGEHIRLDSALFPGYEVSTYYDPLLAKLMAWDETRDAAIDRLNSALQELRIEGVKTNITTLHTIISHESFTKGDYDTSLLQKLTGDIGQEVEVVLPSLSVYGDTHDEKRRVATIAVDLLLSLNGGGTSTTPRVGRDKIASPWKLAGRQAQMHAGVQGLRGWR